MARKFCKHYRAMFDHDTCKLEIAYATVPKSSGDCPCWADGGKNKCDKAEYPTPEESAEEDRLVHEMIERTGNARQAIVEACGGPWKRGQPGKSGVIECPNCGGKLSYSRSGFYGHIHARCTTAKCCAWME